MAQVNYRIIPAVLATLLGVSCASVGDDLSSSAALDTQADQLVQDMSDYMGGLGSFTTDVYVVDETIMSDGFKLSSLRLVSIKALRPNKFHIGRQGEELNQEVIFDGSTLVVHSQRLGQSVEMPAAGDVDDGLEAATEVFGTELPARDLLGTDSYTPLMEPVEESAYLGSVEIGGVVCRHLAFRADEVDWQLWVAEGDRPLPCRYTITSRWVYGAPQFTVTFTNWEVNPNIPASDFEFTPPAGTRSTTVEAFRQSLRQAEG